jgi:hypothetical protein
MSVHEAGTSQPVPHEGHHSKEYQHMNITKKSLTTLGVAAAMALGGIAVAQTGDSASTAGNNTQDQSLSSSTMNNSGTASSDLGSSNTTMSSDTASNTTMTNDTSTMGASGSSNTTMDAGSSPVAQVDRN